MAHDLLRDAMLLPWCSQPLPRPVRSRSTRGEPDQTRERSLHGLRRCRVNVNLRPPFMVPPPLFASPLCFPMSATSSQPDPYPAATIPPLTVPPAAPPRRARLVDRQLPLLAPADVTATDTEGHAFTLCGRGIPADGLTLNGPSGSLCLSRLAIGIGSS